MFRRQFLGLVAGAGALAGCAGGSDSTVTKSRPESATRSPTTTASPSPSPTATPTDSPTPTASPTESPTPTPTPYPRRYPVDVVRENAETVNYETLFRNIEDWESEPVYYPYGDIYQALYEEDFTYLQLYVGTKDERRQGDVAAGWFGEERILEDDVIELWGVVEGTHTYETVQGNERTIPILTLVDFELREE